MDQNGDSFQLKGVSTHGITWFPEYVNKDTFAYLKEDWGANVIRLAMYTDTGDSYGYCSGGDQEEIKKLIDTGVTAATELGMYVIIDWHILNDGSPNTHLDEAKEFFAEMSEKYADYGNVIYEIANEPNGGTTWSEVKSYAKTIIKTIRKNSPDAVIIVGCPTWCQDIDAVAADPITDADNIIYSVHFYAATHKEELRNKVEAALSSGIPVIISEFGLCDASGSGSIDYDQSDAWFDLIEKYNLSYACWSFCNKSETASLISSSCSKTSGFTDNELSDGGKYIKKKMQ
ncbi:MAG: glycoside hydrolase family 5 protein [Clostridiales bacterium]|nr:glycoside hydrolase family 5 protein [Clostridiales bacterium]